MMFRYFVLRLACVALAGSPLLAQCYDLGSTHLYHPEGKFKEWWKDHDFRLDKSEWGDFEQFAIFAGMARKVGGSWVPFRMTRRPLYLCEPTPRPDGGLKCFGQPYDLPSPQATLRRFHPQDGEVWSLSEKGVLTYERHIQGTFQPIEDGTYDVVAALDMNTGSYTVDIKGHGVRVHRHLDPKGIELWREQPFTATARLTPVACPPTVEKVSWTPGGIVPTTTEMRAPAPCVVKLKAGSDMASAAFEFVVNPRKASSAEGCVVVHDDSPTGGVRVGNPPQY